MAKKSITSGINHQLSKQIAFQIVKGLGEIDPSEITSVLNGLFVAMTFLAKDVARHATEKGAVEKMIMSWFKAVDNFGGTQFSEYINLEGNNN